MGCLVGYLNRGKYYYEAKWLVSTLPANQKSYGSMLELFAEDTFGR